jgi:hypothetical protein
MRMSVCHGCRHVTEDEDDQPESAVPFAGHTPFRTSRFARTPSTNEVRRFPSEAWLSGLSVVSFQACR